MRNKRPAASAAIGLGGVAVYSWIMTASSGTAASWAGVILVASLAALAIAGWATVARRSGEGLDG